MDINNNNNGNSTKIQLPDNKGRFRDYSDLKGDINPQDIQWELNQDQLDLFKEELKTKVEEFYTITYTKALNTLTGYQEKYATHVDRTGKTVGDERVLLAKTKELFGKLDEVSKRQADNLLQALQAYDHRRLQDASQKLTEAYQANDKTMIDKAEAAVAAAQSRLEKDAKYMQDLLTKVNWSDNITAFGPVEWKAQAEQYGNYMQTFVKDLIDDYSVESLADIKALQKEIAQNKIYSAQQAKVYVPNAGEKISIKGKGLFKPGNMPELYKKAAYARYHNAPGSHVPVSTIKPSKTKTIVSTLAPTMSTLQQQAAGVLAARLESLTKIREARAANAKAMAEMRDAHGTPDFLNELIAANKGKKIQVEDIEANWDKQGKNNPLTFARSEYDSATGDFEDVVYGYFKSSDLKKTINQMYDALTNFGDENTRTAADDVPRQQIARELGFVDAEGQVYSMEAIARFGETAVKKVLKEFYTQKQGAAPIKNTLTKQDMINPLFTTVQEEVDRAKNYTTASFNKRYDIPRMAASIGLTEADVADMFDLLDIKDLEHSAVPTANNVSSTAKYMGGMTEGAYAYFFNTLADIMFHNAKGDVQSETETLKTIAANRDQFVNIINKEAELAIKTFEAVNGRSALNADGSIRQENQDWFRGYLAERADQIRQAVMGPKKLGDESLVKQMGIKTPKNSKAMESFKNRANSASYQKFTKSLSTDASKYLDRSGLLGRVRDNGAARAQTEDIGTSAGEEIANLYSWANANGLYVLDEIENTGGKEKHTFYVVNPSDYIAGDTEGNAQRAIADVQWIAPQGVQGLLNSNNPYSATEMVYNPVDKKYYDVNTLGLQKQIRAVKRHYNNKTPDQLRAQTHAIYNDYMEMAPIQYTGEKDYDSLRETSGEGRATMMSGEEYRRATGRFNWHASLREWMEANRNKAEAWKIKNAKGGYQNFSFFEIPQEVQDILNEYMTLRNNNPLGYQEAILNSRDESLKNFLTAPEFKPLREAIETYFEDGGGYYVSSQSHGSSATGKAYGRADVDLPFKAISIYQAMENESSSKGKANANNRKVYTKQALLDSGVYKESVLRDNTGEDANNLVVDNFFVSEWLLNEIIKEGNKKADGTYARYNESSTEERLWGFKDEGFEKFSKFFGNARTKTIGVDKIRDDFLQTTGLTQKQLEKMPLGQIKTWYDNTQMSLQEYLNDQTKKTKQETHVGNGITIPANSWIVSMARTEDGIEIEWIPETEIKQAQKFVETNTNKRDEYGQLKRVAFNAVIDRVLDPNNNYTAEQREEAKYLKEHADELTTMRNKTEAKRSGSVRTSGSFNFGLMEYLLNQIKTKKDYEAIGKQNALFKELYSWDGKKHAIVANYDKDKATGKFMTGSGKFLYEDDKLWKTIDPKLTAFIKKDYAARNEGKEISEEDLANRLIQMRAAYIMNFEKEIGGQEVEIGSFYHDIANAAANIASINFSKEDIGRRAYTAPGATGIWEYSETSGLGKIVGVGESRARSTLRMKQNILDKAQLVVDDQGNKFTKKDAEAYAKGFLEKFAGEQDAIYNYNAIQSAVSDKTYKELGAEDARTLTLVFGQGNGKLANGLNVQTDQIDINSLASTIKMPELTNNQISEDDYTAANYVIKALREKVLEMTQGKYVLGENAQVRLSFEGLSPQTIDALIKAGFKNNQILAIGAEGRQLANGRYEAQQLDKLAINLLGSAQDITKLTEIGPDRKVRYGNKTKLPQMSIDYVNQIKGQIKSGSDLTKAAQGKKSIFSGNFKAVGMQEDADHGVISLGGAYKLFQIGEGADKDDLIEGYKELLGAIDKTQLKNKKAYKQYRDIDALQKKDKAGITKQYKTLLDTYIKQVVKEDAALPTYLLRNPLIHNSNLVGGLKLNAESSQEDNVLMLPKLLADLYNADFDGDMIQVLTDLTKDNSAFAKVILKKEIEYQKKVKAQLKANEKYRAEKNKDNNKADPKHNQADYTNQVADESAVFTNPNASAGFLNITHRGQTGLGLASYYNTEAALQMRWYRDKIENGRNKKSTPEQIIRDRLASDLLTEATEQQGISAKKGLAEQLALPNAAWDMTRLRKLTDAVFGYDPKNKDQQKLIGQFVDETLSDNEKVQYSIAQMRTVYGDEALINSGLFDKAEYEKDNDNFVLTNEGIAALIQHVSAVHKAAQEGAGEEKYRKYKAAYLSRMNPGNTGQMGTLHGEKVSGKYWSEEDLVSQAQAEKGALDNTSVATTHIQNFENMTEAEAKKLAMMGRVTDAAGKEGKALSDEAGNAEAHTKAVNEDAKATEEATAAQKSYLDILKEVSKMDVSATPINVIDNVLGAEHLSDIFNADTNQRIYNTPHRMMEEIFLNDEEQQRLADVRGIQAAALEKDISTNKYGDMSDQDYKGLIQRAGTTWRGLIIHKLWELLSESNKSIEDMLQPGEMAKFIQEHEAELVNAGKEDREMNGLSYTEALKNMFGSEEEVNKYLGLENRMLSSLQALKAQGFTDMIPMSEMTLGMRLTNKDNPNQSVEMAARLDAVMADTEKNLSVVEFKNFEGGILEAYQTLMETLLLQVNLKTQKVQDALKARGFSDEDINDLENKTKQVQGNILSMTEVSSRLQLAGVDPTQATPEQLMFALGLSYEQGAKATKKENAPISITRKAAYNAQGFQVGKQAEQDATFAAYQKQFDVVMNKKDAYLKNDAEFGAYAIYADKLTERLGNLRAIENPTDDNLKNIATIESVLARINVKLANISEANEKLDRELAEAEEKLNGIADSEHLGDYFTEEQQAEIVAKQQARDKERESYKATAKAEIDYEESRLKWAEGATHETLFADYSKKVKEAYTAQSGIQLQDDIIERNELARADYQLQLNELEIKRDNGEATSTDLKNIDKLNNWINENNAAIAAAVAKRNELTERLTSLNEFLANPGYDTNWTQDEQAQLGDIQAKANAQLVFDQNKAEAAFIAQQGRHHLQSEPAPKAANSPASAGTNASINSFASTLDHRLSMMLGSGLAYKAINKLTQSFKQLISVTEQLDKEIVNIQIATGYTKTQTKDLMLEYSDLAKTLGRTTTEVAEAANEWLRAGYTGQEATDLITASMYLSTLGMMDSSKATEALISVLKGWKLETDEVVGVVDKLVSVDMQAATSAGDIATAMAKVNNSAQMSGLSMDTLIGILTTGMEVSQQAPEAVGNA